MNPVGRRAALLSLCFRDNMSSVLTTRQRHRYQLYQLYLLYVIIAHITCLIDLIVLSVQRRNETSLKSLKCLLMRGVRVHTLSRFGCACQGVDTERSLPRGHCNNLKQKLWVSLIQDSVSLDHISSCSVVQTASDLAFHLPPVLAEEKV